MLLVEAQPRPPKLGDQPHATPRGPDRRLGVAQLRREMAARGIEAPLTVLLPNPKPNPYPNPNPNP